MRRRDLLASTVAACTLTGCIDDSDDPEPDETDGPEGDDGDEEPNESEDPEEGERVEIVESELVREDAGTEEERVAVRGLVATRDGDGEVEVSYVEVRAGFHDAEGETLDTIIEQVEIDPEVDQWGFEVAYPHIGERSAEVEDYELEVGTEL